MGGGLMQLVAYGAQDVYLTGNPQITFFKVVYRRHTNFSMEAIEQTWNGSSMTDGRCTATISRNGDLVHRMYLEIEGTTGLSDEQGNSTDDFVGKTFNPGSAWITDVEIEIGGQKIDKHSGKFLEVWAELTERNPNGMVSSGHRKGANGMGTLFQNMSGMGGQVGGYTETDTVMETKELLRHMHIPLRFWFCKNPGLALPLIALQYHEVKVNLNHRIATLFHGAGGPVANKLWVDYIYLDTDERRRFAQVSHEYLIEQVQERRLQNTAGDHELNFNHPVKELIWAGNHADATNAAGANQDLTGKIALCGTSIANVTATAACTFHLKLNGHDRFSPRQSTYFSRLQVNEYHSGYGGLNVQGANAGVGGVQVSNGGGCLNGICVYSFALKPEEHQPSGTCNFSRIDSAHLVSSLALIGNVDCYAINYNVLRIMSGMGGLAYSN
jgi:hypothetical protein